MQMYEYKVVAAPNQTRRVRGVKTPAGRFAVVLTEAINAEAEQGWEYLRSDSLPVEEKPGLLKSKVENYYTVLVFRRALHPAEDTAPAEASVPPVVPVATPAPVVEQAHAEPSIGHVAPAQDYPADPPLRAEPAQDPAPEDPSQEAEGPFAEDDDTDREIIR